MLRIFEAARAEAGEDAVDRLYAEWGRQYFTLKRPRNRELLADCVAVAGLETQLVEAADDESWDGPIREAMEVASAFGGPKTQTPAIVVRTDPPHGFKGWRRRRRDTPRSNCGTRFKSFPSTPVSSRLHDHE
jgi:hypothetical protein